MRITLTNQPTLGAKSFAGTRPDDRVLSIGAPEEYTRDGTWNATKRNSCPTDTPLPERSRVSIFHSNFIKGQGLNTPSLPTPR